MAPGEGTRSSPATTLPPLFVTGAGKFAAVGYLAALVVCADQLVQLSVNLDSFSVTSAATRFQLAAYIAARIAPLALAVLIALAAATANRSETATRLVGLLAGGGALLLGLAAMSLWFDGLVVRRSAGAEALAGFVAQWARSQLVAVAGCLVLGLLAVGGRRMR